MTQLEIWAKEYSDNWAKPNPLSEAERHALEGAYMAGYQDSSRRRHTPPEPCPPGHNCPDCGSSYVEGIYD